MGNSEILPTPYFAENLRKLRKAKGLSQDAICALLNIKRARYSHWENGNTEPSIEFLFRIKKLYKVSIDQIVSEQIDNKTLYRIKYPNAPQDEPKETL